MMSTSVAPITSPGADALQKRRSLVEGSQQWYDALGLTAARASAIVGEDGDYILQMGLGRQVAELFISAADVDALKPACVVFKALFDAVEGARKNRDSLLDLLDYGILIVKTLPPTTASGLSDGVKHALKTFADEVEGVMQLAKSLSGEPTTTSRWKQLRRKILPFIYHKDIADAIKGHETRLGRIVEVISAGAACQGAQHSADMLNGIATLTKETLAGGENVRTLVRRDNTRTQGLTTAIGSVLIAVAAVMVAQQHFIFAVIKSWRPINEVGIVSAIDRHGATVRTGVFIVGPVVLLLAVVIWKQHTIGAMIRATLFPPLPDLAAVPLEALSLHETYVERSSLLERTIFCLTNPASAKAPCVLVGMGGGGKTVLASAVVRNENIRQHFRGGIFWLRAGFGRKDQLHGLLQALVLQVGVTATEYPRGMPPKLNSLEDVTRHLTAVSATGASPLLVVLDDVWEREVVDALRHTGLQLLVTTRDRSVVSISAGFVEVENFGQDEALELLRAGCGASAALELPRQEALQVADDCGMLALPLSLAAPLLKGPPQHPKSWRALHDALAKGLGTYRTMTVEARVHGVLDMSFGAMADDPRKQERCMFLSVLAQGTIAYSEMLEDLWDEARGATHTFAKQLVDQSMLQSTGDAYRVHDLVLRFLKPKLKADPRRPIATSRIAEHLGKLNVLHRYSGSGETMGGEYSLTALWRSVESLSEEQQAAAVYTRSLSGVTESGPWREAGRVLLLMGRYAEAKPLYERSQEICEKVLGPDHPAVAQSLNDRAMLLMEQGRYAEAEPLYERSKEIREKVLGPDHPDVAESLNNRAELLSKQGKYDEAGPLYAGAIAIGEKVLGPEHPDLAAWLNNRAGLLSKLGKYEDAGPLYLRATEIWEKVHGREHPLVATVLNNRAELLKAQGKHEEADPLYARVLDIMSATLGEEHPEYASTLNNRAELLSKQGKHEEADPLYARVLDILSATLGEEPNYASTLNNRAELLSKQGRYADAEPLYVRSQEIREKVLGPDHPAVALSLNSRAGLLQAQGKYEDAGPLYLRATEIWEKVRGREHPLVAAVLNNRAGLLEAQGKYDEAGSLYARAIAIGEKVLGPEHPDLAVWLNNGGGLLEKQGRHDVAIPLLEGALAIRRKKLGEGHPDTQHTKTRLKAVRNKQVHGQETSAGSFRKYTSCTTDLSEA